jgi:hypothetical protein
MVAGILGATPSLANSQPTPVENSYYVVTTSNTTLQNLGCNEANTNINNNRDSKSIIDFGGQDGNGNLVEKNGTVISDGTAAWLAEWFAYGYYSCLYNRGGTQNIQIGLGTNSSYSVSGATGTDFANNVIAPFYSYVVNSTAAEVAEAADDIELDPSQGWAGPGPTTDWVNSYAAAAPTGGFEVLTDYGSADGCPPYGSCLGGWTQSQVYYVAWGCSICYVAPEIYVNPPPGPPAQAQQWNAINSAGGGGMLPDGPLDEYPLDHSTNTPSQAWSELNAYFPSMSHSMEITNSN